MPIIILDAGLEISPARLSSQLGPITPLPDVFTTKRFINEMVGNFLKYTFRTDPFDPTIQSPEPLDPKKDGYSVWFSKNEIDQLFEANKDGQGNLPTGLRIYLGMHGNHLSEESVYRNHPGYKGQYTTILVCTRTNNLIENDLLKPGNAYTTSGVIQRTNGQGKGDDEGGIHPPPADNAGYGSMVNPNIRQ